MRSLIAITLPLLLAPVALLAQAAPAHICYHARPKPDCAGFVFTNFGAYAILGRDELGGTAWREVADWGAMVNVGRRDAIGVSVFASLDRIGFTAGPAVRYRRWLPSAAALEVAVGMPLAASSDLSSGSIFGLVRWSPNDWFALAVRPEVLRQPTSVCGPLSCDTAVRSHTRVSVGMEFGRVPGAVLTGVSALATFLAVLGLSAAYGSD